MPKIIDHETYRQELLEKALDLLSRQGPTVSMRQIARSLGVSTGTLYHYFPSKDALFIQGVETMTHRDLSAAAARMSPEDGPAERLAILAEIILGRAEEMGGALVLLMDYVRLMPREEGAAFIRKFGDDYAAQLADLLQIPPEHAIFLTTVADGLLLHNWMDPDPERLQKFVSMLGQMFMAFQQYCPEDQP